MAVVQRLEQTYDQDTTNRKWWAEQIHMLNSEVSDNKLQLLLPKVPVTSKDVNIPYDEFRKQKTTLATAIATGTTTQIHLASGDASIMLPADITTHNAILRVGQELLLATAVSGATITVTRGFQSTTTAAASNGAQVDIIGVRTIEGGASRKSTITVRTKITNYVQTIDDAVEVSRLQDRVDKYGGIVSEFDFQMQKSFINVQGMLENALLYGAKATGSATASALMNGIWSIITTNKTADSGSVDTTAIEADILSIFNNGGSPNAILCSGKMAQDIAKLYENRIMTDVYTTIGGYAVTAIINPLAQNPIAIIPHRKIPTGEYFIGDWSKAALGYIDPFFPEQVPADIDGRKFVVRGDYTLLIGLEKLFAFRYGFS